MSNTEAPLKRRLIPDLHPKTHRKGAGLIVARNFTYGEEFIRINQGDTLPLNIRLSPDALNAKVVLSSDMEGDWRDYDFQKLSDHEYTLPLRCPKPGTFLFRVKYTLNDGNTWFWDNIPDSSVMVDPVSVKSLRLYTLIPTLSGPISRWKVELQRIKDLGFNAIHLLPVTRLDESESPYSANDLFDLDPSYGDPADGRPLLDQFEDFIREAKRLGIQICLDIVLNHVGVTSRLSAINPDWIASDTDEKDGLKRAGCWSGNDWLTWRDLVLIKYDHPNKHLRKEIWDYMVEYLLFWSNYADHTGGLVRLDNLHSTDRNFLQFAITKLRAEFPNLTILAELFTDPQTIQKMVFYHNLNLLLATPWVTPYAAQFRQEILRMHTNTKIRYFLPVNSHDSGSPAQEYGAPEAVIPRYAACALLGTGQTGMVQGAEFGAPAKLQFIGRQPTLEMNSRTWAQDFTPAIRQINHLVESHEVFSRVGNVRFVDGDHGAILGAIRTGATPNTAFLILISFDTKSAHEIQLKLEDSLPAPPRLQIRHHLDGRDPATSAPMPFDPSSAISLQPCDVKVIELMV